ncbi:MAG: helix-turn-helix domain-containing protein [Amphiplicatus sp.]
MREDSAPREDGKRSKVRNYIREWRKYRGLTQQELAERIGYSNMLLSRWERRQRRITTDQLQLIADALQCAVYDLLYRHPRQIGIGNISRQAGQVLDARRPF